MSEDREHGRRAGTDEGTATHHTGIIGRAEPSADRPGTNVIHQDETTKVVAFEFDEGQKLADHAAFHPILVQLLRGRVEFGLPDRTLDLHTGEIVHLTAKLRHRVRALDPPR
ncbi:cupin domain-containing protein [Dietzia lutea]|uniref:cupin domain-containing protein n=1 Tax=Dietzia lutea TaxID=546160 RepID=UPI001F29E0BA|nr:cupin domain-containing protein [Dietzia lutea]